MKTLKDFPSWVQHALCIFESLRRLGVEAHEIYFVVNNVVGLGATFCCTIQSEAEQHPPLFCYSIARVQDIGRTHAEINKVFLDAVKLWNDKSPEGEKRRSEIYDGNTFIDGVGLILALRKKGLYPARMIA